jgi:butyrate kinase
MFRILGINVGSTSLKVGAFTDEKPLFKETVDCGGKESKKTKEMNEQLLYYRKVIDQILLTHGEIGNRFDLIVSRGGLTRPLKSGAYLINEAMCRDLRTGRYGFHPSNLGPLLAHEIASRMDSRAIIFDSPVTDEMEPIARVSGLKGIERRAGFHVLSQKAAGRKAARELRTTYENLNLIIAHMGGGITICAHQKGRIIDGTHGLSEGPFTPQRTGALPLEAVIELSFSGRFATKEELETHLFANGGLISYLGTYDISEIEKKIRSGDKEAELILRAMCYQIGKEIGAMAAVLRGRVDAIVLTGNMSYSSFIVNEIKSYIDFLAPIYVFSGDDELENLALGGLEVLKSGDISSIQKY